MNLMPGVVWRSDVIVASASDWMPFDVAMVRDQHLRVVNGTVEDEYLEELMRAAMREGERKSWRSFLEQTREMTLDRVPDDGIVYVTHPPILTIDSVKVLDAEGAEVEMAAGEDYTTSLPAGPMAGYGRVHFLRDPVAIANVDAIKIRYTAGYVKKTGSEKGEIPEDIRHAMLLWIGEAYKTRTLSVQGTSTIPAILQADAVFLNYRPY